MSALGFAGGIIFIIFYLAAALYMGKRLYGWLRFIFPKLKLWVFLIVFIILVVVAFWALMPLAYPIIFIYGIRMAGGYLSGFFMYLFMFFIFGDLVVVIAQGVKLIKADALQKARFYAGTAAVLIAIAVSGYGAYNATHIIITNYEVQLQRDPGGDLNIVLVSDLHLGEVFSERRLEQMVTYINSLNPDIVCIAGDIFNDDFYAIRNPERAAELLRSIETNFGVFACLGNHDTGPTLGSMINFLEESNVHLLIDEHVIIDNRMVLIGRLDEIPPWIRGDGFGGMQRKDFSYIMDAVRADLEYQGLTNLPIVVIDHNPTHINEYGSEVDLALFGHTHGGALFPINLVVRAMNVTHRGHFQRDSESPHIIVTLGVHAWSIPMRVGTNNEIARIIVR